MSFQLQFQEKLSITLNFTNLNTQPKKVTRHHLSNPITLNEILQNANGTFAPGYKAVLLKKKYVMNVCNNKFTFVI